MTLHHATGLSYTGCHSSGLQAMRRGMTMKDPRSRAQLTAIVEKRRRELSERPDISVRMRKLSESNARNPIPQQPKSRPTLVKMLLAAGAVVVLAVCLLLVGGVIAGGIWFQSQVTDPSSTALDFYSALHQQDYARAYGYFSEDAKEQLSQDAFTKQFGDYDSVSGIVNSYFADGNAQISGDQAVVTVDVVRRADLSQAQVQTVYLVKQGNDWRIQRVGLGEMIPAPTPGA